MMKEIESILRVLPEVRNVSAPPRKPAGFPRTLIEDIVAEICGAASSRDRVNIHEKLFDSDGPATQAAKVNARVREAFEIDLSLDSVRGARTVVGLAQLIEAAIGSSGGRDGGPPCASAQRKENSQLSSAQQRIWFLNQLLPSDYSHHLPFVTRLQGPLEVRAIERSFVEVARSHPELRSRFPKLDGQPSRVVSPDYEGRLSLKDLSHLPESEREQEALRLAGAEVCRGFDLSKDRAWRAQLLRLSATDHLLVVTLHQIIADRPSVPLLLGEVQSHYRSLIKGQAPQRSSGTFDFEGYVAWECQWLRGEASHRQLAYWKQQLADAPPSLNLPFDHPRPTTLNPRGASQSCNLSEHLLRRLRALGREEGATLFMTLTATFHALLHRYTGTHDVLVGTPANRRWRSELEGLIGPLTNTVILRGRLGDNPTFREFLRRIRAATYAACRHQDLPFARLVEEMHPDRNLGQAPVFQVMIEQVCGDFQALDLFGLDCSTVTGGWTAVNLDLKLRVIQGEASTKAILEYSPDLFDESTIRRMLTCWQTLLENAASNADQRMSELTLLSEPDRRQLLEEWSGARTDHGSASSVVQLFEREVERRPDAPAVVCENAALTYRELNTRSNQLARYLNSLGVGPDVLVALSVERSLDLAVGLLGILKAGGAYVPLDPDYPSERLTFILKDSAPAVVITQMHLKPLVPPTLAHIVYLDKDRGAIEAMDPANTANGVTPENLAYVIYTSGSTGRPKGVLITHGGLWNLAQAVVRRYDLRADDRVLQFSTLNFDIAAEEIFPTWLCGATLVLRADQAPPAFPQFLRFIAKRRLTVLNLPTAFWHEWVEYLAESESEIPSSLRLVIVGGEQVSAAAYVRWCAIAGSRVRWLNGYGPTETTVTATVFEPARSEPSGGVPTPVPIGRPIDNTEVLVLDAQSKPVPVGVVGELHIGGAGVARGYLNRPDLTAEKFIPHPFRPDGKSRLYKTGDLVRYLPDGNLQFLGRLDHQVKIRGFRIELGEIEALLRQHPNVAQVAFKVWERAPDDKQLAAYVVLNASFGGRAHELRTYLGSRLPAQLIPAYFVELSELPLTPNGKVDHRALPVPDQEPESGDESPAPRDRLEFQLVQIWRDVLRLPRIGIRDSFFDLGGHSLMAVRMFTQIEKLIGWPVPLATLFQAPTIEQLADILRNDGWRTSKSSLVALQARGSKTPFFCVHGGGGGVLWYSDIARHLGPEQPFYGLQSPGIDAEREPLNNVTAMASLYITEIRAVQPRGPYLLGGASMGGAVAYEMAQQLLAQGQKVALLVLLDTPRPVPITRFHHQMKGLWKSIRHEVFERIAFHRQELSQRSIVEKVEYLRKRVTRTEEDRDVTQTGPSGSLVGLRHLGPAREKVHHANALALSMYSPRPYPGAITLFVAKEGQPESFTDPHLGWDGWADRVERHEVPGDHISMMWEPNAGELAAKLSQCLDRAQGAQAALTMLCMLLTDSPQSVACLLQSIFAI